MNDSFGGQPFQIMSGQLPLPQLDIIHASPGGFADLVQQSLARTQLPSIGYVVEQQVFSLAAARTALDASKLSVPLSIQIVWLFVLAIPIACVAWTITHEDLFREPREYCKRCSEQSPSWLRRKFFYLFTCEYCFSHYVAAFFLVLTQYKLLYQDWRGYLIAFFALVWIANQYMTLFANIRVDLKVERFKAKKVEKEVQQKDQELKQQHSNRTSRPAA